MKMLKVGLINYLNAFPFTWPLSKDRHCGKLWSPVLSRPGDLNRMLANNELQVSLVSAFEYLRNRKNYLVAPKIALSSKGYVDSVKLVSKVPINNLHGEKIFITSASATSISILRILLGERGIIPQELITYDCHQGVPENALAALTIGDEALTEDFSSFEVSWDLGEAWRLLFHRDIVFALCVIRKDALSKYDNEIDILVEKLQKAPKESFACEETFAKACRAAYPQIEKPMTYLRKLHFKCGKTEIENLNFYLKLCAKHNLIEKVFEPEYYTMQSEIKHG